MKNKSYLLKLSQLLFYYDKSMIGLLKSHNCINMLVGSLPTNIGTFDRDKARIAHKTHVFLEDSEDFQFNAPFKSENGQDF